MKELTIEEKAARYDEAIEKFDVILNLNTVKKSGTIFADDVRKIFPELKESGDERIRKWLIEMVEEMRKANLTAEFNGDCSEAIAWLEKQCEPFTKKDVDDAYLKGVCDAKSELKKQGEQNPIVIIPKFRVGDTIHEIGENTIFPMVIEEIKNGEYVCDDSRSFINIKFQDDYELVEQKPADKVEQKFKVGDYLVNDYCKGKVIALTDDAYLLDTEQSIPLSYEHNVHLWTIQDAKDGDVLFCKGNIKNSNGIKYERICLFNNLDKAFFTLTKTSNYVEYYDIDVNIDYPDNTVPATKEQKEILFMAMANAGYTFDFEKKELKKIEQSPIDVRTTGYWHVEDVEQKSVWSEEDETYLDHVFTAIKLYYTDDKGKENPWREELLNWLKSLKDRVQQQNK